VGRGKEISIEKVEEQEKKLDLEMFSKDVDLAEMFSNW
jgi:hypothetical protein